MIDRAEQRYHPGRLFLGSRVRDIALIIIGAGLAATASEVDPYRVTTGAGIAAGGIIGIINGLRELKKRESLVIER